MRTDFLAGLTAALLFVASPCFAQRPVPKAKDGHPDLSGIWSPDGNFVQDISKGLPKGEKLPLQPWAEKAAREHNPKNDPAVRCLPDGAPRLSSEPFKIMQTPKLVLILFQGNIHTYRQVFTDGRGHPEDFDPTWYGDSVGKWDGDTLVIDTIGFNDRSWLDSAGHPHTEKMHLTERVRRPDFNHLVMEDTIDDPGAYTKPFTVTSTSMLVTGREIREQVCNAHGPEALPAKK